jgi:hypothetical protein
VILLPSVLPAHATTYAAGVTVGQWAKYAPFNVTYHETGMIFSEPQSVIDLNRTVLATQTIKQFYTVTNVTVQTVTSFNNATTKTEILNGDLMTGDGNLSYALIAGGLKAGDPISTKLSSPTINETVTMVYLGLSRTVNVLNTTSSITTALGSGTASAEFVWDQASGVVLQAKALIVASWLAGGFAEYIDVRITSTNIFSYSTPVPYFTVVASHPPTSGSSATITITVSAVDGFSGTVTLTDTVPSGLTCNAIAPNTITNSGTASMSCSSTTPGTYTVTITATSRTTSHTTATTITIAAAPSQTPTAPSTILGLDPTMFYAIIGIVIVVLAAVAYLGLRSRSKEQEIPSQPTTTVA